MSYPEFSSKKVSSFGFVDKDRPVTKSLKLFMFVGSNPSTTISGFVIFVLPHPSATETVAEALFPI